MAIADGMFTTGEIPTPGSSLVEQALVVTSRRGLVVVTGCAHPGIVQIARQAQEMMGGAILLVMGGFHLGDKRKSEIQEILDELRRLEVRYVAPSHCTGDQAIQMFAEEYGDKYIRSGAGAILSV